MDDDNDGFRNVPFERLKAEIARRRSELSAVADSIEYGVSRKKLIRYIRHVLSS
jgi:hypothetical protein